MAPSLPCDERLRYQIHIPSPASGFFGLTAGSVVGVDPAVCESAPVLSGPVATPSARATAAKTRMVLRRRKRMVRGYERPKHAFAGKGASAAHPCPVAG